jgi:virginiamycin B lyase
MSNSIPAGITSGPDHNLWFTEQGQDKIGRITPTGTITEFPVTPNSIPTVITSGPDGNLWFTASRSGQNRAHYPYWHPHRVSRT